MKTLEVLVFAISIHLSVCSSSPSAASDKIATFLQDNITDVQLEEYLLHISSLDTTICNFVVRIPSIPPGQFLCLVDDAKLFYSMLGSTTNRSAFIDGIINTCDKTHIGLYPVLVPFADPAVITRLGKIVTLYFKSWPKGVQSLAQSVVTFLTSTDIKKPTKAEAESAEKSLKTLLQSKSDVAGMIKLMPSLAQLLESNGTNYASVTTLIDSIPVMLGVTKGTDAEYKSINAAIAQLNDYLHNNLLDLVGYSLNWLLNQPLASYLNSTAEEMISETTVMLTQSLNLVWSEVPKEIDNVFAHPITFPLKF